MHRTGRQDDLVARLDCLLRIGHHHLSSGRQLHAVVMAHEYLNANSVFEVFDLFAQRGLS